MGGRKMRLGRTGKNYEKKRQASKILLLTGHLKRETVTEPQ